MLVVESKCRCKIDNDIYELNEIYKATLKVTRIESDVDLGGYKTSSRVERTCVYRAVQCFDVHDISVTAICLRTIFINLKKRELSRAKIVYNKIKRNLVFGCHFV